MWADVGRMLLNRKIMNSRKNLVLSGMALVMSVSGFGVSAQEALPSARDNGGQTKVTAQNKEESTTTWKSLGVGKYRDNIMHTYRLMGDWYPEWEVEIMESETNPGHYKVVAPYKNSPFSGWGQANNDPQWCIFINAEDPEGVMIPDWYAGFDFTDPENDQEGPLMLWSQAHDYYENIYGNLDQAKAEGLCGRVKHGAITFPPGAILVQIAPDYETHFTDIWRPTNKDGMWRVKLPGAPDIDIDFTYGFSTDGTMGKVTTFLNVDKDVEKVVAAAVESLDAEAVYKSILAGEVDTQEFTESGTYTFDIAKNGKYTVMMVPYYNGEALEPVFEQSEFIIAEADWVACAEKATWSDGFLYGIENNFLPWYESTGQVEVQYSTKESGVIRLVDPFGPDSYNWSNSYDSSSKHYMVFRIDENNNVTIDEMSPTGLDIGYGPIDVWCKVGRMRELEKPEEEIAEWYGKLDGNIIKFPKGGLYVKFPVVYPFWYASNFNDTFRLELPEEALKGMSGVKGVAVSPELESGDAEYYTLSGAKVYGTSLVPGVYIKVVDGKAHKVMVK